ncbi:MAG: hypothetical protein QOH58_2424 [Thermoleophilaceae bacterium]|jgi:hypothetical protein|nr:hypothetical protein [Thermoleophilaceae bacterium]
MTDVERLLAEYKEAHRADGAPADPRPYLARASGPDRAALGALIDAYLARAPRRSFDAARFRDSAAAPMAESLQRALSGSGGLWPALLPRLRNQARLRRAELVSELAARLGAQSQTEKVAAYYHQMEQGLLPATGVSDTVLEALGRIIGYSREALRRAGELPAPGAGAGPEPGAVFARTRRADSEPAEPAPEAAERHWDAVDRLFRGG